MPHYELLVLMHPDIPDAELEGVVGRVKEVLTTNGATITKEEPLGKRKLAYEIDKLKQGIYHLVEFDAPGTAVTPIETAYRLDKQVIRHLLVSAKVRTAEDIQREEELRAKISAKRRAAEEAAAPKTEAVEEKPSAPAEVSRKEIDEKLESILDEDLMK